MQRIVLSALTVALIVGAGPISAIAENKPTVADAKLLLESEHYSLAADDLAALSRKDKRNGELLMLLSQLNNAATLCTNLA
jgi:hypothetical protein